MSQIWNQTIDEKKKQRRKRIDLISSKLFKGAALLSASFIVLIAGFICVRGIQPFLPNYAYGQVSIIEFLFGTMWRQDQGIYGVGFIVLQTIFAVFLALCISFPISVLTALFIQRIAPKWLSQIMTTIVELLASIPSVVYGVFAAGVITAFVNDLANSLNTTTAGGSSLLSVILLLAIMIFPTITSLSITSIAAVDKQLIDASLALGATKTQTNFKIVLLSAKSGIFTGAILGVGRAFGEATAVAMVAGNKLFGPSFDLFDITRTLTSTMLSGLKETTGLDYDIRFSVGLVLMVVIFASNFILHVVKKKVGNVK